MYRRQVLVGAGAVAWCRRRDRLRIWPSADTPLANWARGLLPKKPFKLVAVTLANKIARIAWAIMARNVNFQLERVSRCSDLIPA